MLWPDENISPQKTAIGAHSMRTFTPDADHILQINGGCIELYSILGKYMHVWQVKIGIIPYWIIGYAPIIAQRHVDLNPKAAHQGI